MYSHIVPHVPAIKKLVSNPANVVVPMQKIRPNYAEWQWAHILMRCFRLPSGIFENILDMLPRPRIWKISLIRIKKRAQLAPFQCVIDISNIIDQMVTDMCIFSAGFNKNCLIRISQNFQVDILNMIY